MNAKDQVLKKYVGKTVTIMGTVDGVNPARLANGTQMPQIIINNACVAIKGCRAAEYLQHTILKHPENIVIDIKMGYKVYATGEVVSYTRSDKTLGYGFKQYDDLLVFDTGDRVTKTVNGHVLQKGNKKSVGNK